MNNIIWFQILITDGPSGVPIPNASVHMPIQRPRPNGLVVKSVETKERSSSFMDLMEGFNVGIVTVSTHSRREGEGRGIISNKGV